MSLSELEAVFRGSDAVAAGLLPRDALRGDELTRLFRDTSSDPSPPHSLCRRVP